MQGNYNYESKVLLSNKCKQEIRWWIQEGLDSEKMISHGNPIYFLRSDSSGFAWGAQTLHNGKKTQGFWDISESRLHINVKELKAVLLGVQSLCQDLSRCHLQIQADNQTAVTYINNMGGTHSRLP